MRTRDFAVWLLLVTAGVVLRIAFAHIPNFAPVAAIALFAGYQMRSGILAASVPITVMAVSDLGFGGYHGGVMTAVYACLVFPAVCGAFLRGTLPLGPRGRTIGSLIGMLGTAIGSSLVFFLVTNFAVWLFFDLYQRSWFGLWECYLQALPFYRYTLAGDVSFAVVLFGSLAAYRMLAEAPHPAALENAAL